jgi:hypothetical protein
MNICKRYYLDITGQPYAVHGPGRCAEFWQLWKTGADTREHLSTCPECRAWLEGCGVVQESEAVCQPSS